MYMRGIIIEIYNVINSLLILCFLCSEKNYLIFVFFFEYVGMFYSL